MTNNQENLVDQKLETLAILKKQAKELESQIKNLQDDLIKNDGVAQNVKTQIGLLSFTVRENYKTNNQNDLIDYVTQDSFNEYATISKTNIVKLVGKKGFEDILDKGIMAVSSVSEYFTFKENKEK